MKGVLLKSAIVLLLIAAGYVIVLRFVQVKLPSTADGRGAADGRTYITVSPLFGGSEWPPPRKVSNVRQVAEGRVFDAFCAAHPEVGFHRTANLALQGRAAESAVLMAQAGGGAGDVLYANFRSIDNFVRQHFFFPLDDYVLQYAREQVERQAPGRAASGRSRTGSTATTHPRAPARGSIEEALRLLDPAALDAIRRVDDPRFDPAWIGIHPAVWDTICRPDPDNPTVSHVWAFPYGQETMALNYRKDLFKARAADLAAAGLDPERGPQTWEELLAYCHALTDPARGIYGMYLYRGGWQIASFLWQAGGDVVRRDEQGQWQAVWDSPATVQAVRFIRLLLAATKTATLPDGTRKTINICTVESANSSLFAQGRCAMVLEYASDMNLTFASLDPSVLGMVPLPAGPVQLAATAPHATIEDLDRAFGFDRGAAGTAAKVRWIRFPNGAEAPRSAVEDLAGGWRIRANELNASMWAINAIGTTPARRDAAWKFIRFYASPRAAEVRTRAYVEAGWAQFVNPERLRQFGHHEYLDRMDPQWVATNVASFRAGRPEPNGKNCQYIYDFVFPTFERFGLIRSDAAARAGLREGEPPTYDLGVAGEADRQDILASLHRDCDLANRALMGRLSPERLEQDRRRAYYVVAGIVVILLLAGWGLVRSLRQMVRSGGGESIASGQKVTGRIHAAAWGFLALATASVLAWSYYPLARGAVIAFQDYSVATGGRWVGLANFVEVFNSELFLTALLNTFLYVGLGLLFGFFTPIFLAILLDEIPRGRLLFRTLYYLPAVMSGLVVAYLWKWMYEKSDQGALNHLLMGLHLIDKPINWLGNPQLAMLSVVIPLVWAGAGPGCIIYLAALKSIPEEVYEAADIDGAGAWGKIRHITFPYLKPLIVINFVGAFIGTFKSWQNIFVMTGGGPDDATHVIGMEVWYNAFAYLKFGYATAVAWIIGSMLIGFTLYQLRILRNMRFTTAKRE